MAMIVEILLVILWIQSTETFTKYSQVINRLNFGLRFESEPGLDVLLGYRLHLYTISIPETLSKNCHFNHMHVCPMNNYIALLQSLNHYLHKHVTHPNQILLCSAINI